MQIYWFTGRSLDDLCSTTQISLASGLIEKGYAVTIVNPDEKGAHQTWPWEHQSIIVDTLPGFRSRTLGKKMLKWFTKTNVDTECVMLVDWRIANSLVPEFEQRKIPWILIDRSPPADRGILSLLQWPSWKKGWKFVRDKKFGRGCVVSEMHSRFVQERIGVDDSLITVLPAGVDLQCFKGGQRFQSRTMVYHGKLDRNRGILALPMLLQKVRHAGIDARLIIIGRGDCFDHIDAMAQKNDHLEVHPALKQEELARILAQCHIGLLPMPNKKIWTLASPLKRSEYAASGLVIFGIDHAGHRFKNQEQKNWIKLVNQYDFHEKGVEFLKKLSDDDMTILSAEVRAYAEENLSWSHTIGALEKSILSIYTKHS